MDLIDNYDSIFFFLISVSDYTFMCLMAGNYCDDMW